MTKFWNVVPYMQWSSTREDLFPESLCLCLGRLYDRAPKHSYRQTRKAILEHLKSPIEDIFEEFALEPCASGSIAQVSMFSTIKSLNDFQLLVDRNFLPCLAFIIEAMVIFIVVRGLASLVGEEQWAIKYAWFTAARKSPPLNQDSSLRVKRHSVERHRLYLLISFSFFLFEDMGHWRPLIRLLSLGKRF